MNAKTTILFVLGAALLTFGCSKPENSQQLPDSPEPIIQPDLLTQTDQIPGKWEIETPQDFPPIGKALRRTEPGYLVYGLYAWADEYLKFRDDIKKVGWPSIRIAGPFHDEIMAALAEDGTTTMVTVGNWLLDPAHGADRTDYKSDKAFIDDYIEKIDAFAARYGPGGTFLAAHPELPQRAIVDIELWNEPNFQYMIPPDGRPWQEMEAEREKLYAKMLPAAYAATKAKHPAVNIVGFATGGMSGGDLRFIEHVHGLDPDVAESYDTLSTHPYVRPAAPEASSVKSWGSYSIARGLGTIRNTLAQYGRGNAPVWHTEIGWPILEEDGGHFATTKPRECVPPLLQAAYVCRTYALALRLDVARVHIMYVTDADGFNAGFFDKETKAWRPAAKAVQTMISILPSPKLTGSISDGTDGYYAYTYLADELAGTGAENQVVMAWNLAGPKTVQFDGLPEKATVTDMLGTVQTLPTQSGRLSVETGPYPVYISPAP